MYFVIHGYPQLNQGIVLYNSPMMITEKFLAQVFLVAFLIAAVAVIILYGQDLGLDSVRVGRMLIPR